MSSVNTTNFNIDQTVRVYDQFYQFETFVPAAEYDIVYSFFLQEMKNARVAGNFTVSLFQVAESTGIEPLTLLDSFRGVTGVNLTASLVYYLNQIRSRATLLGLGVPYVANFYAVRNVVQ